MGISKGFTETPGRFLSICRQMYKFETIQRIHKIKYRLEKERNKTRGGEPHKTSKTMHCLRFCAAESVIMIKVTEENASKLNLYSLS